MDHYEENWMREQAADSGRESGAEAERAAVVKWLRDGIEKDRAAMGRAGSRGDYKTAVAYMEAMERDRLIADAIESGQHLSGDRER